MLKGNFPLLLWAEQGARGRDVRSPRPARRGPVPHTQRRPPKNGAVGPPPALRSLPQPALKGTEEALPKFLAPQWLKCYHFYSCNRDEVPGPSRSINLEIY